MELSVAGLHVSLTGRPVLTDVSAVLRPGRITAILGPNGAGKSSLVRTMATLIRPERGQVRLGEEDVVALDRRRRARLIGYLPQDPAVHWNVRVAEVVALGRLPHHGPHAAPSAADRDAMAAAMEATAVTALAERPVAELSGGERARVLLARVLAGQPAWLLADEPLASLDPAHQIDLLARLRAYADGGAGVVIVVHDLVQAQRVADDALLLADGRLVAAGPAIDVLTAANLEAVFGVRVAALDHGGTRLLVPVDRAG